jgi:hypothetical protein
VPNRIIDLPDHLTVMIQTKDGRHVTEDAYVTAGATDKWDSVATALRHRSNYQQSIASHHTSPKKLQSSILLPSNRHPMYKPFHPRMH